VTTAAMEKFLGKGGDVELRHGVPVAQDSG
jgi:hypothetical protein